MGIFDKIIEAFSGRDQQGFGQQFGGMNESSPLGGLFQSLTGRTGPGGLSALVQRLTHGGLGDTVNSWVGTGPNKPVSAEALNAALGADRIAAFAQRFGMSIEGATAELAKALPDLVDKMTPNGQIEEEISSAKPARPAV